MKILLIVLLYPSLALSNSVPSKGFALAIARMMDVKHPKLRTFDPLPFGMVNANGE